MTNEQQTTSGRAAPRLHGTLTALDVFNFFELFDTRWTATYEPSVCLHLHMACHSMTSTFMYDLSLEFCGFSGYITTSFPNLHAHDTTYVPTNHRLIMQNETVASQFNLLSVQFLFPISRLFSVGYALNSCAHQNWFAAAKEIIYSLIYLTRLGECRVLGHAYLLCAVCAPYEVNGPAGVVTVLSKTYPVTWKTNKWIYFFSFMTFEHRK